MLRLIRGRNNGKESGRRMVSTIGGLGFWVRLAENQLEKNFQNHVHFDIKDVKMIL